MMPIVNAATTKKVQVQNVVKAAPAIWARVYHNAAQSIPDAATTALNFNSERFDTDVIHDTSTNNERLTCKTAGVYLISASVGFVSNATGFRALILRLNGTTFIALDERPTVNGNALRLTITTVYQLAVNDYVEALAYQTSGGALNTDQGGNYSPEFMLARLGA